MRQTPGILGVIWRSLIIAAGYVLSVIAFGVVASVLGVEMVAPPGAESALPLMFIAGFLLSLLLGPLASRMVASRWRQLTVWLSVVFFNMGSVAIEGAFFAPDLVPVPMPILLGQQLLASATIALLITQLFSVPASAAPLGSILRLRPWHSWMWRVLAASVAYLIAYFVFGAINYSLVTRPYYEAQVAGLTTPSPQVVLIVQAVRSPLIILSVALFVVSYQASRRRIALTTGFMLFWVGGIVPLLLQVSALPLALLAASAVEILFQNFLTGALAALLLIPPRERAPQLG